MLSLVSALSARCCCGTTGCLLSIVSTALPTFWRYCRIFHTLRTNFHPVDNGSSNCGKAQNDLMTIANASLPIGATVTMVAKVTRTAAATNAVVDTAVVMVEATEETECLTSALASRRKTGVSNYLTFNDDLKKKITMLTSAHRSFHPPQVRKVILQGAPRCHGSFAARYRPVPQGEGDDRSGKERSSSCHHLR